MTEASPIIKYMVDPLRPLLQEALQADDPVAAVADLTGKHPELPEAVGKSWSSGFGTDGISPQVARFLVDRGAPLSVHAAAGFGFFGLSAAPAIAARHAATTNVVATVMFRRNLDPPYMVHLENV